MTNAEAVKCIDDVLNSEYYYDESLGYQLTSDDFEWLELSKTVLLQCTPEHTEPPKKVKVVTGCPLCDEIWSSAEAHKHSGEDSVNNGLAIVMVGDKPWLYILGDDWYVMPIEHCPKCGRRLMENDR